MSEGGEPSAPATPGLIPLSYTTPWDAAPATGLENRKAVTLTVYDKGKIRTLLW